ncbi:CRIB domain-containing protein RIC7-like [Cucurbita maxima]|uniref:CRIB domain-containing protein RIC7-like n=1 Tax=Cucurbita maxima TaxID=3661 RepID=A0A6J1INK5_CUCMA|nr:CRIB domain-containing protein RIC7-like [Cucurbita maxima]XP_022979373.1 CRIB domain-containing protein RIC7-like [Cucurbita maxima]
MGTSVKGLMKGIKYISQIFDEKEQEMQIGLPTDVKHVAHIGWDGPSANQNNTPTWMNEFKSSPQSQNSGDLANSTGELALSSVRESGELDVKKEGRAPRSKRQTSTDSSSSLDSSSARRNSEKNSRRQRSSCPSGDSGPQEGSSCKEGSSRHARRRRGSAPGNETSTENPVPKHSHRRKSKGSSDGGESSKSRNNDSLTDITLPVLEAVDEEKG